MAADAEALAKKLALGGSELRFLLVHHKVSDEIQCELYQNGIDSIAKFAASATDEADLKQMLKDSFSIDPSASLKLRAQAAGVVVAWKTATLRVERQAEAEATNEVRAGWDGTSPFLPTARGGQAVPRWGGAMLAWQVASPR